MIIREGTLSDTKEIIAVLKASLGESKLPKTEEIWLFKHFKNPFGKSLILVAEEDNKIVGVRAFMRWEWQLQNHVFSTYRAVDTATHPQFQGRGIFKKLTLRALEIAEENGDHFIFNTPNSQSLPGYLKMGWKKINNLKIYLAAVNPFFFIKSSKKDFFNFTKVSYGNSLQDLIDHSNAINAAKSGLFTKKSVEYLNWRYENNPLQNYEVRSDEDFYLVSYIKKHKNFNELRIVEQIFIGEIGSTKVKNEINKLSKNLKVHIISSSNKISGKFGLYIHLGPILTLRNLNLDDDQCKLLLNLNNWNYNLGDLELF